MKRLFLILVIFINVSLNAAYYEAGIYGPYDLDVVEGGGVLYSTDFMTSISWKCTIEVDDSGNLELVGLYDISGDLDWPVNFGETVDFETNYLSQPKLKISYDSGSSWTDADKAFIEVNGVQCLYKIIYKQNFLNVDEQQTELVIDQLSYVDTACDDQYLKTTLYNSSESLAHYRVLWVPDSGEIEILLDEYIEPSGSLSIELVEAEDCGYFDIQKEECLMNYETGIYEFTGDFESVEISTGYEDGTFQDNQSDSGEYDFDLENENGENLATTEGQAAIIDAINNLDLEVDTSELEGLLTGDNTSVDTSNVINDAVDLPDVPVLNEMVESVTSETAITDNMGGVPTESGFLDGLKPASRESLIPSCGKAYSISVSVPAKYFGTSTMNISWSEYQDEVDKMRFLIEWLIKFMTLLIIIKMTKEAFA